LTEGFTFEALSPAHDRAGFSCGVAALDRYLRELATQDIRRRVSNCFVALDRAGTVAGYYTFAATSLPLPELAPKQAKRLPRHSAFPACLFGRLAVDQVFRGRGLGSSLIVDAIARAMHAEPAMFALVVDARDEAALGFCQNLGFHCFASRPMTLYLPIAEAARRLGAAIEVVKESPNQRAKDCIGVGRASRRAF
jgi:ribosomal protein S18 acetylase RimI-like enzyme